MLLLYLSSHQLGLAMAGLGNFWNIRRSCPDLYCLVLQIDMTEM